MGRCVRFWSGGSGDGRIEQEPLFDFLQAALHNQHPLRQAGVDVIRGDFEQALTVAHRFLEGEKGFQDSGLGVADGFLGLPNDALLERSHGIEEFSFLRGEGFGELGSSYRLVCHRPDYTGMRCPY